jgi:purine-nucleoside phosphorylase
MQWRLREDYARRVEAAAAPLRGEGFGAPLAMVLGSGLGNFVDHLELTAQREFAEIPGFFAPTVQAHQGRLVQGRLPDGGGEVLVLQGRLHAYEGHPMEDVVFPVATLMALGATTLVLTNAAGGCHPDARAGDLLSLTGLMDFHGDALRGLVLPPAEVPVELALRAGTHNRPFDRALAMRLVDVGAMAGIAVQTGTYVSLWGPNYETPREIGHFRAMGVSAIGMSTGPEASFAHRLGARVVGISCITNVAREHGVVEVTHDEVIEVGAARREDFARLLLAFGAEVLGRPS